MFLDKIITSYTQYWPLVLGLVILALLLFLRGGIAGFIVKRGELSRPRSES
jgi:ABC-type branched-subunit amino acid transport system permease subunit